MGIKACQLLDAGRRDAEDRFREYWGHIDTDRWPGQELKWIYCHPVLFVLFLVAPLLTPLVASELGLV